jgi:ABC-type branched-subunit amino acid transport system ATPase component
MSHQAAAATAADIPLLSARGVDVSYGALQVLFGVNLDVLPGERLALLGTNGAGKSTLLNAVSGLLTPTAGSIVFAGEDITGLDTAERVRRGLVQMPGGRATFSSLTVAENIRIGAHPFCRTARAVQARLDEVLDLFPVMRPRLDQPAGTLSGGEQQMMALARAMTARPILLMIDELSLGLAPVVLQDILAMVERIVAAGTTIIVVEQSLNVACEIAERATFMEKGEVRFSGNTSDLLADDSIARSVFFGAAGAAADGTRKRRAKSR